MLRELAAGKLIMEWTSRIRVPSLSDWERGYLVDRHRDLAWAVAYPFGDFAEDGKTVLACGLMPVGRDAAYEKASGLTNRGTLC